MCLSPSASRMSIRISLPNTMKKPMRVSGSEASGLPTAAPPKVKAMDETKATVMLPMIPYCLVLSS